MVAGAPDGGGQINADGSFTDQYGTTVPGYLDDPWDGWDETAEPPVEEFAAPVSMEVPVSAPPGDVERDEDDQEGATKVLLRSASGIEMKGTRWIYRGRIPMGMVTLLAGREGIGKSTVSLDIAARLTRGTLEGRYEGRPQPVVICATEDSWEHTIVPRLMAVGADMEMVYHISVQDEDGNERAIVAPQDTRRMEKAFRKLRPALMLIDPLMAILDGKIDTHKQSEVQQALEPMVKMCARVGMSLLALIHVNKSGGTDPLNNIMGSKAFATLPRSILYCIEEDGEFLMCHVKCNVGAKMPSIRYTLQSVRFDLPAEEVDEGDDPYIESSKVIWGDVDERSAADVLAEAQQTTRVGDARAEVVALVSSYEGIISTQTIREKLEHLDYKQIENALLRAAKKKQIARVAKGQYRSVKPDAYVSSNSLREGNPFPPSGETE